MVDPLGVVVAEVAQLQQGLKLDVEHTAKELVKLQMEICDLELQGTHSPFV